VKPELKEGRLEVALREGIGLLGMPY